MWLNEEGNEVPSSKPRGFEPDDVLVGELRAIRTHRLEERERLLAARPLLEHLRRRLDEVALHARSRLRVVVDARQHAMQHVPELVHEGLELVVVQALAVEVGDERGERRASREAARAADRKRRGMVVLAL